VKVKRTVIISLAPSTEILTETKGKSQQSTLHAFFKKGEILNQELHQKSQISALCHSQRSIQVHYSATYKNFQPGLWTYQSNVQNLFIFSLNVIWLLYIHVIDLHS